MLTYIMHTSFPPGLGGGLFTLKIHLILLEA